MEKERGIIIVGTGQVSTETQARHLVEKLKEMGSRVAIIDSSPYPDAFVVDGRYYKPIYDPHTTPLLSNLIREYGLVQKKESKLSRRERDRVVMEFKKYFVEVKPKTLLDISEVRKYTNYKKGWDGEGGVPMNQDTFKNVSTFFDQINELYQRNVFTDLELEVDQYYNSYGAYTIDFKSKKNKNFFSIEIGKSTCNVVFQVGDKKEAKDTYLEGNIHLPAKDLFHTFVILNRKPS